MHSETKYRMSHSSLNNAIILDRIIRMVDDEKGIQQDSLPNTCAFLPDQLQELENWLAGDCPEYLAFAQSVWTQDVVDAYAEDKRLKMGG